MSQDPLRSCLFWKRLQLSSCKRARVPGLKRNGTKRVGREHWGYSDKRHLSRRPDWSTCEWQRDLIKLQVRLLLLFKARQWLPKWWSPDPLWERHGSSLLGSHPALAGTLPGTALSIAQQDLGPSRISQTSRPLWDSSHAVPSAYNALLLLFSLFCLKNSLLSTIARLSRHHLS